MPRSTKTKSAPYTKNSKPRSKQAVVQSGTKAAKIIALLKAKRGATVPEMMKATGWQAHSIRGFLAGSLRTRHRLQVASEKTQGEPRRYRLA